MRSLSLSDRARHCEAPGGRAFAGLAGGPSGKLGGTLGGTFSSLAAPALFALVGVTSGAIDVGIFWLLITYAPLPPLAANGVSYSLAALNSFILNKRITFRQRRGKRSAAQQALSFLLVRLACLAFSSATLAVALVFLPRLSAKLLSVLFTFLIAYVLHSRLVFR